MSLGNNLGATDKNQAGTQAAALARRPSQKTTEAQEASLKKTLTPPTPVQSQPLPNFAMAMDPKGHIKASWIEDTTDKICTTITTRDAEVDQTTVAMAQNSIFGLKIAAPVREHILSMLKQAAKSCFEPNWLKFQLAELNKGLWITMASFCASSDEISTTLASARDEVGAENEVKLAAVFKGQEMLENIYG